MEPFSSVVSSSSARSVSPQSTSSSKSTCSVDLGHENARLASYVMRFKAMEEHYHKLLKENEEFKTKVTEQVFILYLCMLNM
jgi:hypothetical protein